MVGGVSRWPDPLQEQEMVCFVFCRQVILSWALLGGKKQVSGYFVQIGQWS